MGRMADKTGKLSKAFAEGLQAQQAGDVIGTNPHVVTTPEWASWNEGWFAGSFRDTPQAWQATFAYTFGEIVTNGGNIYSCVNGGDSGSTGPTTTDHRIVDGTCEWQYQGPGSALDLGCAGFPLPGSPPYIPTWADWAV